MSPAPGSRAIPSSSLAAPVKSLENALRVGHPFGRLLHWVAVPVFLVVLALIAYSLLNMVELEDLANAALVPRRRLVRVLVDEVAALVNLKLVQLTHESEVHHSLRASPLHFRWVALLGIQCLPRRKCSAHRTPDEEHRLGLLDQPPGTLPVAEVGEIPRVTVLIIHRQVQGESGGEPEMPQPSRRLRHARRRVDLRYCALGICAYVSGELVEEVQLGRASATRCSPC